MAKKKSFRDFLKFLGQEKLRFINLLVMMVILSLLPVKNFYTELEILAQEEASFRYIDFELGEIGPYPVNAGGKEAPKLTANSALVVDVDSRVIMLAKNPDFQLLPASTTKLMTALVSLEHYGLTNVLEVKRVHKVGQRMRLVEGEQMAVKNLLYGLLVQSGNDAAYVLAENYPGGLEAFVSRMNEKARELNLFQTKFTNPAGIDSDGQFISVHDLSILAAEAIKEPIIEEMVGTRTIMVPDISGKKKHNLKNINALLGRVEGVLGIKTGWTKGAGECLVGLTEREGKRVITVVLDSEDRFGETKKLINWVFENFEWEEFDSQGE